MYPTKTVQVIPRPLGIFLETTSTLDFKIQLEIPKLKLISKSQHTMASEKMKRYFEKHYQNSVNPCHQ